MTSRFALALPAAALAAQQPVVLNPPAPPPLRSIEASQVVPAIVRYHAEDPACGGREVRATLREEPFPSAWRPAAPEAAALVRGWDIAVRFRLDGEGRPLGIELVSPPQAPLPDASDVAAAFAAWRFERGRARTGCEIRFHAALAPVERADEATLYRYLVSRRLRPLMADSVEREAFGRISPSGRACAEGPVANRSFLYPNFRTIPQPPATISYTYLRTDIDPEGVPRGVRAVGSSGNAALDAASVDALQRSRFAPVARHDCSFYYYRRQPKPLQPPPLPPERAFRTSGSSCRHPARLWANPPSPVYPSAFEVRNVEGWAVLRYDLSPEGTVSNAEVVAAEPAQAFGAAAAESLGFALAKPSRDGHRGCVTRVVFRMAPG